MGTAVPRGESVSSSADTKPEAISVQRAALLLDVHENTIYNWIRVGYLQAIRLGPRVLRIPRTEIARLRVVGTIHPNTTQ